MRVVLDTNIWISGLLWRGLPWKLLRLAEARQVEICMAPPMLEELERVSTYERLQPRLQQRRSILSLATVICSILSNTPTYVF